jgi:hypothetical protein
MGRTVLNQIKSKILGNLACIESSLHTLALESEYRNINFLLPLHFPNLKWLSLSGFAASQNVHAEIMAFFERHPQLESLSLAHCLNMCFKTQVEVRVLPNLRHLKVRIFDLRQRHHLILSNGFIPGSTRGYPSSRRYTPAAREFGDRSIA